MKIESKCSCGAEIKVRALLGRRAIETWLRWSEWHVCPNRPAEPVEAVKEFYLGTKEPG